MANREGLLTKRSLDPQMPHYSRGIGRCLFDFVYIDPSLLFSAAGIGQEPIARPFPLHPMIFKNRDEPLICDILSRLAHAAKSDKSSRIALVAHWFSLFLLEAAPAHGAKEHMTAGKLDPAIEKIISEYALDLNLKLLADSCAMSENWFLKRFREAYGISPMQYLHRFRTEIAAELLLATALSVTEIGMICGYNSPSELYRHFKAFHGVSPREYREELRKGDH